MHIIALIAALVILTGCQSKQTYKPVPTTPNAAAEMQNKEEKVYKTDEEWRKELSKEAYHILREKGTEPAFSGKYWNHKEAGTYYCAGCNQKLFSSDEKFESGCGWPSFWDVIDKSKITLQDDYSYGMHRTEVLCSKCGGHLGHVFADGPKPTGLRYCINSDAMRFEKSSK